MKQTVSCRFRLPMTQQLGVPIWAVVSFEVNKKTQKHKGRRVNPLKQGLDNLAIDKSQWEINVDFTKGMLTSNRGAVVMVKNLKTGKQKKISTPATSKKDVRLTALELIKRLIIELS